MSRPFNQLTINTLHFLQKNDWVAFTTLHRILAPTLSYKEFYNALFRMISAGLMEKKNEQDKLLGKITSQSLTLLKIKVPKKDGVWKLVIFDVPEKHKKVRNILRAKLNQLGFKKWQNSIWASPYELDTEIEKEFLELGKKFFIRLIKTQEINLTEDLEKLF
jgi:DNA-binding transcriptional regulator PaaX